MEICAMTKLVVKALFACLLALCASGARAEEKTLREPIEWSDIWVPSTDKHDLPRVLLVGDSITRGYYEGTEKSLAGKAYCARYSTSKFIGHSDFLAELQILLDAYRFDVIHINNGLHGWDYTEKDYAKSFPRLLHLLKAHGKGATVIWATTTPVRTGADLAVFDKKTERVKERNRIAVEIMRAHEIPVDDLFALVEHRADWYSRDGTHFNDQGKAEQGRQVAESVLRSLRPSSGVRSPVSPSP